MTVPAVLPASGDPPRSCPTHMQNHSCIQAQRAYKVQAEVIAHLPPSQATSETKTRADRDRKSQDEIRYAESHLPKSEEKTSRKPERRCQDEL